MTSSPVSLGSIVTQNPNVQNFLNKYFRRYNDQKALSYFDSAFSGENLTYQIKNVHLLYCHVRVPMLIHGEMKLGITAEHTGKILTTWCSYMTDANKRCNYVIVVL